MQYTILKYFLLHSFVCAFIISNAQNYAIHSEYISTKQGLSNNFVNDMIQDKEGFIWIATRDGLNRYDGYNFEIFRVNADKPNGLNSNHIHCLTEDKEGNIWIGTHTGLAKWNKKTNKIISIPIIIDKKDVNLAKGIQFILCDKQGNIWVANGIEVFLYNSNSKEWKMLAKSTISGISYIGEIQIKNKFEIVMVEVLQGLRRCVSIYNNQTATWDKIIETRLNIKYISNEREIFLFNQGFDTKTTKLYQSNFSIANILYDGSHTGNEQTFNYHKIDGKVFFIEDIGILQMNSRSKKIVKLWHKRLFKNPMSDNSIKKVFVDKSKNLWVYGNGIALLPFKNLESPKTYNTNIRDKFRFRPNSIRSVYQDKYGRVWTNGYGKTNVIFIFNNYKEYQELVLKGKLDNNYKEYQELILEGEADIVYKIVTDPSNDNYVYVASDNLHKVDIRTLEFVEKYNTESVRIPNFIFLNKKEILFISKHEYRLSLLNLKSGKVKKLVQGYQKDEPTYIYQDTQKQIWIGFTNRGIGLLNSDMDTIQHFAIHKNRQVGDQVFCIYEDSKNRFWVGTNLGLNLMNRKTKSFTHFTEEDGLANNTVYGILEDKKGNLWLSTNKGISKFNPKTKQFTNFDVSEGLQDNEFNFNAFFKNKKTGEMFFGGIKGLNSFEPEKMTKNTYIPPIVLTAFKRKGKKVDVGKAFSEIKQIEMNYDEAQSLSFEFVTLNYFQSYKNRYAYKIEEIHEDWIDLGRIHELTLTNLNAGTYTLRIKGSNNDGLWNEEGITITLVVSPPFWQTWWFRILLVLLSLALVYGLYRWRVYRIRRREKFLENEVNIRTEEIQIQAETLEEQAQELNKSNATKDQLFAIIAHDLRSPMIAFRGINRQIKHFIKKQEPEKIQKVAQNIEKSTQNLEHLLNNLLNWAMNQKAMLTPAIESFDVYLVAQELVEHFTLNAQSEKIILHNKIPENTIIESDKNIIHTILRNLISNALKFTPKNGKITVSYEKNDNQERIAVSDTGIGMNPEKVDKLFKTLELREGTGVRGEKGVGIGLKLCYELAQVLGVSIEVKSSEGQGSTFSILNKLNH